jgi:vitamin B12 transporter
VALDANGSFALTEAVRLTLRVENLLDSHHQQIFGYGEPGLSGYAGVSLSY